MRFAIEDVGLSACRSFSVSAAAKRRAGRRAARAGIRMRFRRSGQLSRRPSGFHHPFLAAQHGLPVDRRQHRFLQEPGQRGWASCRRSAISGSSAAACRHSRTRPARSCPSPPSAGRSRSRCRWAMGERPMSSSTLLATTGACMRAAAAVLALGAFITSPSDQMFSKVLWRSVVLIDVDPAGGIGQAG
jgi:hypothetical protein